MSIESPDFNDPPEDPERDRKERRIVIGIALALLCVLGLIALTYGKHAVWEHNPQSMFTHP